MIPSGRVLVVGTVHSFGTRDVAAREASPASRTEDGRFIPAVEAREAYRVHEVALLTSELEGGFLTVLVREDQLATPPVGERVAWVVRPYAARERSNNGTWYNRVNCYFEKTADDVRIRVIDAPASVKAAS